MLMSLELLERVFFLNDRRQSTMKINYWKPHLKCSPEVKKKKIFVYSMDTRCQQEAMYLESPRERDSTLQPHDI